MTQESLPRDNAMPSRMELDRAAEVQTERLLERDVQEAELLKLLGPAQRTDIHRAQTAVGDQLCDLPLRVVVVTGR